MNIARLAVICDLIEENWPSMDLVAEMLLGQTPAQQTARVEGARICPPMRRRFTALPMVGQQWAAHNADRLLNRFWDYPRMLRQRSREFDLFHLCDHSYAQLLHALPGAQTGVFCHDLDTFRCLLEPEQEPRPRWFKKMAAYTLQGLQRAGVVFYTTATVRQQIERHGLLDPARLVQAPYGISPEYRPEPQPEDAAVDRLTGLHGEPFILHVGSCIPRKRIDVLLDVFAALRAAHPELKLVQAGGEWTNAQQGQLKRLGIAAATIQLPRQKRRTIAALYRRATLVLLPSEAEGFGLPIIEALACGSVTVASDIPVFREVGGEATVYCPLADVAAWAETAEQLLTNTDLAFDREKRLAQARRYSWEEHGRIVFQAYRRLQTA
ncbi:MAG: glycosyltransferase family 1 protein [Acidobacteriota bacterium]